MFKILVLVIEALSGSVKYHNPPHLQPEGWDYISALDLLGMPSTLFTSPAAVFFSDGRSYWAGAWR